MVSESDGCRSQNAASLLHRTAPVCTSIRYVLPQTTPPIQTHPHKLAVAVLGAKRGWICADLYCLLVLRQPPLLLIQPPWKHTGSNGWARVNDCECWPHAHVAAAAAAAVVAGAIAMHNALRRYGRSTTGHSAGHSAQQCDCEGSQQWSARTTAHVATTAAVVAAAAVKKTRCPAQ